MYIVLFPMITDICIILQWEDYGLDDVCDRDRVHRQKTVTNCVDPR